VQTTGRLFVVSGPSGSGKSTMCRAAARRTGVHLSISATTRSRGPQEVDGRDYYFLSEKQFLAQMGAGEFLEFARVFDHYYGTPAQPVHERLARGENVILEIDVQGARQVFARSKEAVGVLVLAPSQEEMVRRIRSRKRDDEAAIEKRLAKAEEEIRQARACGRYVHTIVNDDLERAIGELTALVRPGGPTARQAANEGSTERQFDD